MADVVVRAEMERRGRQGSGAAAVTATAVGARS